MFCFFFFECHKVVTKSPEIFKSGNTMASETQSMSWAKTYFLGDSKKPLIVIDSPVIKLCAN